VNREARVRAMPYSRSFGALILVAVAIAAAPPYVASQPRTDKVEKAEAAAHDARPGNSDSWLTTSDMDITREGDPVGFIMAVVGSIIVLAVYRFSMRRTATV